MKNFLKLIETARTKGINGVRKGDSYYDAKPTPLMWSCLEDTQPIVFTATRGEDGPTDINGGGVEELEFDAPFKNFSVEMLTGAICAPRDKDEKPIWVYCVAAFEMGPKSFEFLVLCKSLEQGYFILHGQKDDNITATLLKRLNVEKAGAESVRERVKIGTGAGKKTHTIRRIIHVSPKNYDTSTTHAGRTIDWTHRFFVRGHWRKCSALGKDRQGNYSVSGHTWVTEHIRGPEHMPLISKTRLVEAWQR